MDVRAALILAALVAVLMSAFAAERVAHRPAGLPTHVLPAQVSSTD